MLGNLMNFKQFSSALTRFLAVAMFMAWLAAGASAQISDVYLGIKTGNESGAGSYGSKIKVKITFVNNTGATEVGESWLSNATLERDGWSWAKLSMRYDMSLDPTVKMIRLENHGTNSAITGDNWLCESVCVSYDGRLCSGTVEFNQWINGGAWAEKDNPNFRPPTRPQPRPQPEPSQSVSGVPTDLVNVQISRGITNDRKFLSVPSDGDLADLWNVDDKSGRQQWRFRRSSDGTSYNIFVADGVTNDRKYLSVTSDGTKVDLYNTDDGSGRQRWIIENIGNGLARIRISGGITNDRKYLSVTADGTKVDLYNVDDGSGRQRWKIATFR